MKTISNKQIKDLAMELYGVYAGGIGYGMPIEDVVKIATKTIKEVLNDRKQIQQQ